MSYNHCLFAYRNLVETTLKYTISLFFILDALNQIHMPSWVFFPCPISCHWSLFFNETWYYKRHTLIINTILQISLFCDLKLLNAKLKSIINMEEYIQFNKKCIESNEHLSESSTKCWVWKLYDTCFLIQIPFRYCNMDKRAFFKMFQPC
jgi:hypothetical protein